MVEIMGFMGCSFAHTSVECLLLLVMASYRLQRCIKMEAKVASVCLSYSLSSHLFASWSKVHNHLVLRLDHSLAPWLVGPPAEHTLFGIYTYYRFEIAKSSFTPEPDPTSTWTLSIHPEWAHPK